MAKWLNADGGQITLFDAKFTSDNFGKSLETLGYKDLIKEGKLEVKANLSDKKITFHDPCYLGRGNGIFDEPRDLIKLLGVEVLEMERSKRTSFCCGAGGAQMFKEAEKGNKEINIERTEDALETSSQFIATGCPFCNTMMTDGVKNKEQENKIHVKDIAELISKAEDL